MITFENAFQLDLDRKIEEAAAAYEEVIQQGDAPVDAFINLACIYWETTDFGFNTGHNLSHAFFMKAGERVYKVLDEAQARFGELPEITFWRWYFDFTYMGESAPPLDKCLELLKHPEANLVPYFYLYSQDRKPEYLAPLQALYNEVLPQKTIKNRYIISIIDSMLRDEEPTPVRKRWGCLRTWCAHFLRLCH